MTNSKLGDRSDTPRSCSACSGLSTSLKVFPLGTDRNFTTEHTANTEGKVLGGSRRIGAAVNTPSDPRSRPTLLPFYFHHTIFAFAISLQPAVLPAVLLGLLGHPALVFLWHAPWTLLMALLVVPTFNLLTFRSRLIHGMIFGIFLDVVVLCLLGPAAPTQRWVLLVGSLVNGFHCALYWMPRHVVVSLLTPPGRVGQQVGRFKIIDIITATIGPILGGAIADAFTPNAALAMAATITLLSVLPLLRVSLPTTPSSPRPVAPYRKLLADPTLRPVAITAVGEATTERFFGTAWSLLYLLFLGDILSFAIITGLSALVAAATSWWLGRHFDRARCRELLQYTTLTRVSTLLLFPCLAVAPYPELILVVSALASIAEAAHSTVAGSYIFSLSTKLAPADVHAVREQTLSWTRLLASILLGGAFLVLPTSLLWVSLSIGALSQFAWFALLKIDPRPSTSA